MRPNYWFRKNKRPSNFLINFFMRRRENREKCCMEIGAYKVLTKMHQSFHFAELTGLKVV